MTPRLRALMPFGQHTGYGQAAQDTLLALHRAEVELDIVPVLDFDTDTLHPRYHCLLPSLHRNQDPNWPTHFLVHTIPFYLGNLLEEIAPPPHVKRVAMTTWETTKVPAEDAKQIQDLFDLLIVPCEFNKAVFTRSGVASSKIVAIPHAFDPAWWAMKDPWQGTIPPRDEPFTFYTITVWAERKHVIGLLKAYWSEFRHDEPVTLKIVTPSWTKADVSALAAAMGISPLAKVEFLGGFETHHGYKTRRLSDEEIRDLHFRAHCYVTATRGEGWGLGAFEAAIVGNPVIAPSFSGLNDFLGHYSEWDQLAWFLTPAVTPEAKTNTVMQIAGMEVRPVVRNAPLGITGDQHWAEPDLFGLQKKMRARFMNRTPRLPGPPPGFDRFTSKVVGHKLRNVLESL